MNPIVNLINQHPYIFSAISTWFVNTFLTAFVSSLPAPTKDSTQKYVFFFKLSNQLIGNLSRARSSQVEASPNFQDAMQKANNQPTGGV